MKYIAPNTAVKTIEKIIEENDTKRKHESEFNKEIKFEVPNIGCVSTMERGTEKENNKR